MLINTSFRQGYPHNYRRTEIKLFDDISVVEVGFNRVPEGKRQIMKRDVYILHYITKGECSFLGQHLKAGQGYIVVPDELEIISADKGVPYESYWIMFKGTSATDILEKCGLPHCNSGFSTGKITECAEIIRDAIFAFTPDNELEEALTMQSIFYKITALHCTEKKMQTTPLSIAQNVKRFIKENYHREIKIEEMAHFFGVTRNYLYTLFNNEYQISPQEYLLNTRIEKAKLLFMDKTQQLSVSEVAFAIGFNDPLYFSRFFRKKTGMTPTEFKEKN